MNYDPRTRTFDGIPEVDLRDGSFQQTATELITWITDGTVPDSDITILLCTRDGEVDAAFHAGDCWRWVGTDQPIKDHEVKAWAHLPHGPH